MNEFLYSLSLSPRNRRFYVFYVFFEILSLSLSLSLKIWLIMIQVHTTTTTIWECWKFLKFENLYSLSLSLFSLFSQNYFCDRNCCVETWFCDFEERVSVWDYERESGVGVASAFIHISYNTRGSKSFSHRRHEFNDIDERVSEKVFCIIKSQVQIKGK